MECPHIPEISYGQFGKRLREKIADKRLPLGGSLELTFRCNLRCVHCYLGDARLGVADPDELRYGEICDLLDQVVDEGCLWLLLTGGEPLLRADFLDIHTYAKRKGLLVTLFTNGTLITPQIADYLKDWRPLLVEITLYGRTRETYERITGVAGSYERCLRGIELLLDRDVPVRLKTMALTLNKHEVLAMKEYAKELGASFRFDPMVNAGLDGAQEPTNLRLAPEEVLELDLADAARVDEWRRFCDRALRLAPDPERIYVCTAGMRSFHIDPHGMLSMCLISRGRSYDLRSGSFHEGWHDFLPRVRDETASASYECNQCELISLCGQCPGWAQLEHGDREKRVDFLCEVAHLRAQAFAAQPTAVLSSGIAAERVDSEIGVRTLKEGTK
jgi:radical SAM protein with 4Fe4S-binding SPASM domain